MMASDFGHVPVLDMLLKNKAQVDVQTHVSSG